MGIPNPPGASSWLWVLIYAAVGMYVIPLLLGLISGRAKAKESAPK